MVDAVSNEARRAPFGALYDLLAERFPDHRSVQGLLDIPRLAKEIEVSHETLYRAVRNDKITIRVANKLIQASEDADLLGESDAPVLTQADLLRFVFN